MALASTVSQVRQAVAAARQAGKRIGFVPTMGALHAGHGALIDRCVAECDFTVVSIFVNPLQFGPREDFSRYPRTLPEDLAFCRERGVDLVFAPSEAEMYPQGQPLTFVDVEGLTEGLCGAFRPGHFRGVATVVTKLFNIVAPDRAYFGEKDYQQLVVIRRMVADLNFPIEIVPVPTVREADGLAVSSRNQYLSPAERQAAPVIFRALTEARHYLERGERDPETLKAVVRRVLASEPLLREEYVEVVDAHDLKPLAPPSDSSSGGQDDAGGARGHDILIAVAAYIGTTRLIDNLLFSSSPQNSRAS